MRVHLLFAVLFLCLLIKPVFAVQSTITESESYACMGDDKSRKQTEQTAMTDAKRKAAESVLTYVKSETRVKDFELEKDLVSAYANASVKVVQEVEKAWYKDASMGDCFGSKSVTVYASTSQLGDIDLEPLSGIYGIKTKDEMIGTKTRGVLLKEKGKDSPQKTPAEFSELNVILKTER